MRKFDNFRLKIFEIKTTMISGNQTSWFWANWLKCSHQFLKILMFNWLSSSQWVSIESDSILEVSKHHEEYCDILVQILRDFHSKTNDVGQFGEENCRRKMITCWRSCYWR